MMDLRQRLHLYGIFSAVKRVLYVKRIERDGYVLPWGSRRSVLKPIGNVVVFRVIGGREVCSRFVEMK